MSENKFVGSFASVEELVAYLKSKHNVDSIEIRVVDLQGAPETKEPRTEEAFPFGASALISKIKGEKALRMLDIIEKIRQAGELAGIRDARKEADKPIVFTPPESFGSVSGGIANAAKNCDPLKNYDHGVHVPASTIPQVPENKRSSSSQPFGLKYDSGKAPLSLIDSTALEQIAQVLSFGAAKYEAHNWRGGISYSRLLDAALRHLYAFADGEDLDKESGLSHIAHAGCCIVFLLGMIHSRPDMDDRYKAPNKGADDNVMPVR